jgi:predicted aconitase
MESSAVVYCNSVIGARTNTEGRESTSAAMLTGNPLRHKHFGAAAASSGGVEMYHIVGVTPEAETLEMALGGRQPMITIQYGNAERRRVYETLNANGRNPKVDYVMLGCPHASIEQFREVARLLSGKKIKTHLWMFTSRAVKTVADMSGFTRQIEDAGGVVMTDTCSAIARAVPKGTKVVALDSAKQTHYLPAIVGVEAWFGTTEDCIHAAVTGHWAGELH